jgi:hypothetical protein
LEISVSNFLFVLKPFHVDNNPTIDGPMFKRINKEPHYKIPPHHMPQIQWEMFVEGLQYSTFICATATRGMTIFQVQRDDDYIYEILSKVSEFYRRYVLENRRPPRNFCWNNEEDYIWLLERTLQLVENTPVHIHVPQMTRRPYSLSFFL